MDKLAKHITFNAAPNGKTLPDEEGQKLHAQCHLKLVSSAILTNPRTGTQTHPG
jgi:hypothetical protein